MYEGLTAHSSGVYVFGVHFVDDDDAAGIPRTLYTCTSMDYTMSINAIPALTVTLGRGEPLAGNIDTYNGDAYDLWKEVLTRSQQGYPLLPCSVYEAPNDGLEKSAIFHGYIVGASQVYKATNSNSAMLIRVQCMGVAALLYASPLAAFRVTSGAVLADVMTGWKELPSAQGLSGNALNPQSMLDEVVASDIIEEYLDVLVGEDIVTRLSCLANIIVALGNSGTEDSSMPDPYEDNLDIAKCLYSNYTLNTQFEQFNTEEGYNLTLYGGLLAGLQGSSIFDSIIRTINNNEVMLNILPHFKLGGVWDDFRMEVAPSLAWNTEDKISIPWDCITSINSNHNAIAHLNDPNVFVVSYGDSVGPVENCLSGGIPECVGVFSRDPDIAEYARLRFSVTTNEQRKKEMAKLRARTNIEGGSYKLRCYPAPQWLDYAFLLKGRTLDSLQTPEDEPPDDITAKGGTLQAEENGLIKASDVADEIAKALFTFIYGRADTAMIELTPNIRFGLNSYIGCLENSIGRTIKVGAIQGMLKTVRYSYVAGEKAASSYFIELDRVRIIDDDEVSIECPLYSFITDADAKKQAKLRVAMQKVFSEGSKES